MPPPPPSGPQRPPGSRRRPDARAAALLALLCVAAPAAGRGADRTDGEEAERELLRQSWAQACGHYDELTNWTARQACNLAWFHAHEKGVWQHNLNPHGPLPAGPSS